MNRLTMWYDGNHAICENEECSSGDCPFADPICEQVQNIIDRLAAYEDTGLEPEEIKEALEGARREFEEYDDMAPKGRLRELAQADREGRCVVLPCKVGDTVYQLDYMTHSEALKSGVPQSDDPWQKRKYGRKRAAYLPLIVREKKMVKTLYKEFGKTVFLTRGEADAALRREQDG